MKSFLSVVGISSLIIITGCSGGGSGGPSSLGGSSRINQTFSDEMVTNFQQTEGVIAKSFLQIGVELLLIPSAYAEDGLIKCISGTSVAFEMDVFGTPIDPIETTCSADIDLDIRRGLLKSLIGKDLIALYGGGNNAIAQGRVLELSTVISEDDFWGVAHGNVGTGRAECKDSFTFNKDSGAVVIDLDEASSSAGDLCYIYEGDDTNDWCDTGSEASWNTAILAEDADAIAYCKPLYRKTLSFRFKDGLLEYAPSKADLDAGLDSDNYNAFCVANPANDDCDVSFLP